MGLKGDGGSKAVVPVQVDAEGKVKYDAILRQGHQEGRVRWQEGGRKEEKKGIKAARETCHRLVPEACQPNVRPCR
jgi:hypothetical protein